MPTIKLTSGLRKEYEDLFRTCHIKDVHLNHVDNIVDKIQLNKSKYQEVSNITNIPYYFIATIHNMESSLNFTKHLHNGDPLSNRTIHVPRGYPKSGNPPFIWEESAIDALKLKKLDKTTDWGISNTLYQLEKYNGFGYRTYHPSVLSPYLWSLSNHYVSGKYIADGKFDINALSTQCGAAVILRRMAEHNYISFSENPLAILPFDIIYSTQKSYNPIIVEEVIKLQKWLNTFNGIFVRADGVPGPKTSDAYKKITGEYLNGDPRKS